MENLFKSLMRIPNCITGNMITDSVAVQAADGSLRK